MPSSLVEDQEEAVISDDRVEIALKYLADTDERCAELKSDVERTEFLAKVAESMAFQVEDGNNEERKAKARTCAQATVAWERHFSAIKDYETIRAKRERHCLVVEVWRSLGANRRAGNL